MIWNTEQPNKTKRKNKKNHFKKTPQTIVYGASQTKIISFDLSYVLLYTYIQNALAFRFIYIYGTRTYAFYRKDAVEKHKIVNTRVRICWQLYLILTVSCFLQSS